MQAALSLPDNNPKTRFGMVKPSVWAIPSVALLHLGQAMADGMRKYGLFNWRQKKVSASVYCDAAWRHLEAWKEGETFAADSGVHHLGHAMACLAIILDAEATGNLNDDRGPPGAFAKLAAELTARAEAARSEAAKQEAVTQSWVDDALRLRRSPPGGSALLEQSDPGDETEAPRVPRMS